MCSLQALGISVLEETVEQNNGSHGEAVVPNRVSTIWPFVTKQDFVVIAVILVSVAEQLLAILLQREAVPPNCIQIWSNFNSRCQLKHLPEICALNLPQTDNSNNSFIRHTYELHTYIIITRTLF